MRSGMRVDARDSSHHQECGGHMERELRISVSLTTSVSAPIDREADDILTTQPHQ